MSLVNPKKFLDKANKGNFGVCAFNVVNLETMQAILTAANNLNSPVIVQASSGAIKYAGVDNLVSLAKNLSKDFNIDFALHLDHGQDFAICKKAIDAGFTSVMIDASSLPFDENVKLTKQVVDYAKTKNVYVEGELGKISGIEDEINNLDNAFTNPKVAKDFITKTGVDSLAVSVGTSHGAYKIKVVDGLKQNIITEIHLQNKNTPLVLHGASNINQAIVDGINNFGGNLKSTTGIDEEQVSLACKNGICKINIDSDLRLSYTYGIRKFLKENPEKFDIRDITKAGRNEIIKTAEHKIKKFTLV